MMYLKSSGNVYYIINNKIGGGVPAKVVLKNCATGEKTKLELSYIEIGSKYKITIDIGNLPKGDYEFNVYDKCDFLLYNNMATTLYEKEVIPTVINNDTNIVYFNNK